MSTETDKNKKEVIHTKIWWEEPEKDNPFAAKKCYCAGFDVYGDLLGKASWAEYLYLLFKLEKPNKAQANLLETIAVAIANPGIRDHSVRAAMNAGVGGSTAASALMAGLAVGAGQYCGAREVLLAMQIWEDCEQDLEKWENRIINPPTEERIDTWAPIEHTPGFDPHGASCPTPVRQTLNYLGEISGPSSNLVWLKENRQILERHSNKPLTFVGVISAALCDLDFSPEQGEMLYLLLRLPGAAVHALEQRRYGWRKYPFFIKGVDLLNDPISIKKKI